MSYSKGEDITTDELNGIISIFKHFHEDKEIITNPEGLNELEDCTFQYMNSIYTNEELIFEAEIIAEITPYTDLELGQHYLIKADYYEYTIDDDPTTSPVMKSGIFDLESIGSNQYKCTLDSDVIYMKLSNMVLITKYDNKIIRTAD